MVSGDTAREADGTNLLTPCDLEEIHAVAGPTASRLAPENTQKTHRSSHSNRAPRALFSPHHRMTFLCSFPRIYYISL
jgi:hypothetical protein